MKHNASLFAAQRGSTPWNTTVAQHGNNSIYRPCYVVIDLNAAGLEAEQQWPNSAGASFIQNGKAE